MKKRLLHTFSLVFSLILLPLFSFAQGDYSGLVVILITAFILLVVLGIVSIIFTVKYFRKGTKSAFLTALIPAVLLYLLISYLLSWGRGGIFGLWQLIPLLLIGLLFYKQIKDKSQSIWPYVILNLAALSAISVLIFTVEISGDYALALNFIFRGLGILSYSFFAFLFTNALLQSECEIQTQNIFIKINLFIVASWIIGTIISLLRFYQATHLSRWLGENLVRFVTYSIPIFITCNFIAFITIQFFPQRKTEEEQDLL